MKIKVFNWKRDVLHENRWDDMHVIDVYSKNSHRWQMRHTATCLFVLYLLFFVVAVVFRLYSGDVARQLNHTANAVHFCQISIQ